MASGQAAPSETSPTSAPSVPSASERVRAPKTVVFSKYPLPSDRTPFVTHFEILARFVTHSRYGQEPIAAEKIEGDRVPKQAAQMNVRFLTDVGLLRFESKGLYLPTPEAIKFVNAKTVADDRARPILRGIIQSTWFAEIASSVLRMRPAVNDEDLIGELALAAETNREKKGQSLRVLVEYLVWSGLVRRDERGLSLGPESGSTTLDSAAGAMPEAAAEVLPSRLSDRRPGITPPAVAEQGAWHIVQTEDFFLKVRSDPDIVEDLRDQLALLSKKIERLRSKNTPGTTAVVGPEPTTPSRD